MKFDYSVSKVPAVKSADNFVHRGTDVFSPLVFEEWVFGQGYAARLTLDHIRDAHAKINEIKKDEFIEIRIV